MKKLLVALLVVSFSLSAEGEIDNMPPADDQQNQMMPINDMPAGAYEGETITRDMESTITSLAKQIMDNKKTEVDKPVIVTSFVRLDNFHATSEFGRVLGESLIHELSVRGFRMSEFRGQAAVSVNSKGEYFITRKVNNMNSSDVEDAYVLVGTYSRQFKKVMINARLIDNRTGKIISTARVTFEHGMKNDCTIFNDCLPPKPINIIAE